MFIYNLNHNLNIVVFVMITMLSFTFNLNSNQIFYRKIALAFSGGADSICLLLLINIISNELSLEFIVLNINHKLKDTCNNKKKFIYYINSNLIKYYTVVWSHKGISNNIQKNARNARYYILLYLCNKFNIKYLFIGHQINDQIETILHKILKKYTLCKFINVSELKYVNNIYIYRPLIHFSKTQILDFIIKNKVFWFEDTANYNLDYDRIKIRQILKILNYKNNISRKIKMILVNILKINLLTTHYINKIFFQWCCWGNCGEIFMKKKFITYFENEIIYKVVDKICKIITNNALHYVKLIFFINYINDIRKKKYCKYNIYQCQIISTKKYIFIFKNKYFIKKQTVLLSGKNYWDRRYLFYAYKKNIITTFNAKIMKKVQKNITFIHNTVPLCLFSTPIVICKNRIYISNNILKKQLCKKNIIPFKAIHIINQKILFFTNSTI